MRARWVALLLALPALSARAQAPSASVVVRPDTVTVGQPFLVEVRVRAARGAAIVFPAGPDSTAGVQALDPRAIANGRAADAADRTATYRLAAWDVGTLGIPLGDVVVLMPPLGINDDELDELAAVTDESIREVVQ